MARTYPDPWVPRTFSAWITKHTTNQRTTDRVTGAVVQRPVDCWDVQGRADGVQWLKRFRKAGLAQTWKTRMESDFATGLLFDARTKQFIVPEAPTVPVAPTVFELTELFFGQHPEWEPATKESAARSFNRARRWLLVPGAEPTDSEDVAVDDFLRHASFLPHRLADRITPRQRAGQAWLEAHSARADSLSPAQVEEFVARFENSARDPERRISPATITRFLQPIRQCWTWAVSRDDILIDRSPWVVVRSRKKVKGKATMATGRTALAVDADMVLSVPQSLALAQACVSEGSWGGIVECFVLVMALCGLRWGEATGLLWEDVELPNAEGPGWLVVRRSHRPKEERWLDTDEDPEWGPLKDRDVTETRRVPVPPLAGHQAAPSPRALRRRARRARLPPQRPAVQQLQLRPQRLGAGPVQVVPPPSRPEAERSHANPSCHNCAGTTCDTPPARGGSGREWTPSSASAGPDTGPCRCSSTSTRAWRPAERTRVSSGWSGAWPGRRRSGRDAAPTYPIRRPRGVGTFVLLLQLA